MLLRKRIACSLVVGFVALAFPRLVLAQSRPTATLTPTRHVMTFAGDSIIQGYGATTAGHTVVNRLGELRPHWWIMNYSFGGASVTGTSQWASLNANYILPLYGNPIVVFLGTNDWGSGIAIVKFRISYSNFLRVLDRSHPQVICVTPIWRKDEDTPNSVGLTLDDYRKAITQICAADRHPVIDGSSLIPHDPKNYIDGLHPNDAGYAYYARNLAEALDKFVSP
jgi:lysophospholipase L1-like esterase